MAYKDKDKQRLNERKRRQSVKYKDYQNNYRASRREEASQNTRQWYLDNPEHAKAYRKIYYQNNKEAYRWRLIFKNYGLTKEAWQELFISQGECCAICKTYDASGRLWHVDHDHATGAVRGILCHGCNTGLGGFKDNPEALSSAINYLVKYDSSKNT